MRLRTVGLSITLTSVLAACSSKDAMLPVPDQDMKAVYNQHMNGVGDGKLLDKRTLIRRDMTEDDVELTDYVRTEKNQLQAKFKRIPNPTMYMFVAPHLASDTQVPIPGYLTEFKMWDTDHYALPGEVSDMAPAYNGGVK